MVDKEVITAYRYIKELEYLPASREGVKMGKPSNSEIRRWLQNRSVIINGIKSLPDDEIEYPIRELVFFPKGQTVTMVKE